MKPIIVIGTYCPDDERKLILEKCVDSLQRIREDFDLMISTHTLIPENVAKKVDYIFYDANNDLIYDWDLANTPWFCPWEGMYIVSSLISNYSTYLASNRLLCGAMGLAKNFGYEKAHWIDYDAIINDYSELYENLGLLEDHVAVQYKLVNVTLNSVEGALGIFQGINLNKVNKVFTTYNKDILVDILINSPQKTNEVINQQIYSMDGEKIYYKNFDVLLEKGNIFNGSQQTEKDSLDDWTVPYYDTKSEKVNVVVWNSKKNYPIDVHFLINGHRLVSIKGINNLMWAIEEIGSIEEIDEILTIVDNKIKNHIIINTQELKEKFIRNNRTVYGN